jgi:hypothetical protein
MRKFFGKVGSVFCVVGGLWIAKLYAFDLLYEGLAWRQFLDGRWASLATAVSVMIAGWVVMLLSGQGEGG